MNRYIEHSNKQYREFMSSRNAQAYFLSTKDDKGSWTHRVQSFDTAYLRDRGEEWVRLKTVKDYQVTAYKVGG